METLKIKITRATAVRGQRIEVGAVVDLAPLDAAGVLEAGRGRLVDPADQHRIDQARAAAAARALGASYHGNPGPWARA